MKEFSFKEISKHKNKNLKKTIQCLKRQTQTDK